jgi:hypothetical protein
VKKEPPTRKRSGSIYSEGFFFAAKGGGKFMYSPKISEAMIPILYRMAKDRDVPMTVLINRIIGKEIRRQQKKDRKEARNERDIDASGRRVDNERST